jgi:hypothetical protein
MRQPPFSNASPIFEQKIAEYSVPVDGIPSSWSLTDKYEAESAAKRVRDRAVARDLEVYLSAIDEMA